MSKPKLIPVSYNDNKNAIRLNCYADTLVYEMTGENSGKLLGIRFGGYPEQVRGISDAIFGGGQIAIKKQYKIGTICQITVTRADLICRFACFNTDDIINVG